MHGVLFYYLVVNYVGRDLQRSADTASYPVGYFRSDCLRPCPIKFWISPRLSPRLATASLGNLFQCLIALVQVFSFISNLNFLYCNLSLFLLVLSLAPDSPGPPIKCLKLQQGLPLTFASWRWAHAALRGPLYIIQPPYQIGDPFLGLFQCLSCTGELKTGHVPHAVSYILNRKEESPPWAFMLHFDWCSLVHTWSSLFKDTLVTRAQLVLHQYQQVFCCKTGFCLVGPQPALLPGVTPSWGRTLCLPLLNFLKCIGSSIWTCGRTSSLWGWRSPGTGCPGRLWSLLLWRYSRPAVLCGLL